MSRLTLEAKLERAESTTPWGFRMQGGKDFSCPITIARVTPGSLAAKCGLQQGDIILKIGNTGSENLKHKEAQDSILTCGNKLDLLLQRIRDKKKKIVNGTVRGASNVGQNQMYSSPTISYQSPVQTTPSAPQNLNYNVAPKPFGSSKPTPYGSQPVDNLTYQTQNITLQSKVTPDYSSAAKKYIEDEEPQHPSTQSRSFKHLQDIISTGQVPTSALKPLQDPNRRSPSPRTVSPKPYTNPNLQATPSTIKTTRQFNTPAGLYSKDNLEEQQSSLVAAIEKEDGTNGVPEQSEYDEHGKKLYRPSETFKLIHEQEGRISPEDKSYQPEHSRTFKLLQQQVGEAPAAPPPPKAPAAPKPGVWSPGGQSGGQAPTSKPFTPKVTPPPPAPAMARAPPSKPTGVGGVRGKIGDAVIKTGDTPAGGRIPVCASCGSPIRGPFVLALGKSWCPDHFVCANPRCGTKLLDIGFIEEGGFLYCEKDYEQYFAPHCAKCDGPIVGECVNALNKTWHPSCFLCHQCKQPIGGNQFHLEDGNAYCENDWKQMFQTMCSACNFPIEPGDHWVEALGSNFHSECFNCSTCQVNLEGQPFFAKGGKPYCKKHAR